ncbi:MMPL family transporter [Mycoplasmatota bacterium]|nr:MMPL family transporter [Mycoplasmatota bacterium]
MKKLLGKGPRMLILSFTLIIVILSIIFSFHVNTNYDMTQYLPSDSETKEGLSVLDETFGNHGMIELMITEKSMNEIYLIKQDLLQVEAVMDIIWIDSYADISDPSLINPQLIDQYYDNENALLEIIFYEDGYDLEVEEGIEAIKDKLSGVDFYMRGEPINNIEARNIAEGEIVSLILIILPVCLLVLIFASMSWIEPFIVLLVLGIGVLVNLGTNAFLPNVSFITLTIASALQLAISLDYSLFFIHRYYEFKDQGEDTLSSVNLAFKKSLPVISASALTTMVGFLALLFMRYRIGQDIGIVLSKGILLSYLSVIFLLPILIVVFNPLLEKTRHKHFMFHLGGLKKIFIKLKYILPIILLVLLVSGIYLQGKTTYLFGTNEYAGDESTVAIDDAFISETYGSYQRITILLEDSDKTSELSLIQTLIAKENIIKIEALYTSIDPSTPESLIPRQLLESYQQGDYTRMTLYTDLVEENEEMFLFNSDLEDMIDEEYSDYYILGVISSTSEIRDTVLEDTPVIMVISVGLIFLVILIVFRNIAVPILLLLVIQTAIWFNMGLLALNDREVVYIGYLVVLALQLGATIDYAMLYASRYIEARLHQTKEEALYQALKKASIPIMISGLVLASAGFIEMLFSDIMVVSDIGLLIGRGALFSIIMVLFFLPSLMYVFDKLLIKKRKS